MDKERALRHVTASKKLRAKENTKVSYKDKKPQPAKNLNKKVRASQSKAHASADGPGVGVQSSYQRTANI